MRSTSSKANTVQTFSKGPSILSKVAAPFTSRKRTLSEFFIESDEPYRQYIPGDIVKGSVIVKVDKAINVTHLVICLHGFAKVFSNAKSPGKTFSRDGALMSNGSGKRGAEYFGNGFASLFENEVALCGEGRLKAGRYKFEFQLELPPEALPSSIDFERGTISYMLTSTMTKPTAISPTAQCHCKVKVVGSIDIARLQAPKPRTVSMEAVSRKSRTKAPAGSAQKKSSAVHEERTPDTTLQTQADDPPQSPVASEISSTSATTSSTVSWQLRSTSSIAQNVNTETRRSSTSVAQGISASIELLRGGCLPGDNLPLHIFVSHNKAIKSVQGIIITFFRLARVDTHPAIPIGPSVEGKKPEYEDYYPKSRTGLGGLSLSSAGSSRCFRQDLNQIFAPLIVDPRSLTTVVKTSIKVPEDLFPTISTVPGQMISFRYYVEIVVDLRGKLGGQDRVRSQLGIVNGANGYGNGDPKVSGVDASSGLVFPLASGFGCLDTSQIRRERSVVSWPFEVIVGTRDSERKRVKQNEDDQPSDTSKARPPLGATRSSGASVSPGNHQDAHDDENQSQGGPDNYENIDNRAHTPRYIDVPQSTFIPPPQPEELDEKTRLQRAEQRLLPSEPPNESSTSENPQPSAPEAVDQEDFVYRYRLYQPRSRGSSSTYPETIVPGPSSGCDAEGQHPAESASVSARPGDDKQELEMRRLQLAASSPEGDEAGSDAGSRTFPQPTAPITDDYNDQMYDVDPPNTDTSVLHSEYNNNDNNNEESLPLYKK